MLTHPPSIRAPSIRAHLIALGLALILPVLLFAGLVMQRYMASEEARLHQDAREVARATAQLVDQEIQHWEAIIELLARSPSLGHADLAAFYAQASEVASEPGINVVLRDRTGQQLLNTLRPWGEPLPMSADRETDEKVFVKTRTQVSDLYFGAVSRRPLITITAPVFREGEVVATLTLGIETVNISRVLTSRNLPEGWTSGIIDRKNVVVARSRQHDTSTGKPADPNMVERITGEAGSWSGFYREKSTPSVMAYHRAPRTGWVTVVGARETVIFATLYRSLAVLAAFGLFLAALALILAFFLGRRIARPMLQVAEAAAALGEARDIAPLSFPVREVQAVADALNKAAGIIRERDTALRRSEEQYRCLVESLPALAWIIAPNGATTLQNRRVRDYTGVSFLADLDAWTTIVHPADLAQAREAWTTALERESAYHMDVRLRRRDGTYRWHQIRGVPIQGGPCGNRIVWLATAMDVEELKQAQELQRQLNTVLEDRVATARQQLQDETLVRRRAEDQLRHRQKMEAVSRLAGGIAQDFNNKFVVISANLQAAVKQTKKQPEVTRKLLAALVAADRAGTLLRKLLTFADQHDLRPQDVDVAEHLRSVVELLGRSLLSDAISVDLTHAEELWALHIDPHQLETAMLNLALNAREAMPEGGTVSISAANIGCAPGDLPDPDLSGDFVRITVQDTGVGIAADQLERVFEPFFSTKDSGEHTGLGLSQVYAMAKQHGGAAGIESAAGAGTTVSLFLPKAARSVRPAPRPSDEERCDEVTPEGSAPPARILLVEDDADVAAALGAMIEEMGYVVRLALGSEEALAAVASEPPDLVLTGMTVPGSRSGVALGREIRARVPVLPVILMTGQHLPVDESGDFPVVAKPIASRRLDRAIRRQLSGVHPAMAARLAKRAAARSG